MRILLVAALLLITPSSLHAAELFGEDTNGNGVWDDLEPMLYSYAEGNERNAIAQYIQSLQFAIEGAGNTSVTRQNTDRIGDAVDCIYAVFGEERVLETDAVGTIEMSVATSTEVRAKAYVTYWLRDLSGFMSTPVPLGRDLRSACAFVIE